MFLHFILAVILLARVCQGSHFRGGIITMTPTGQDLKINVTYRVSWRRSYSSDHFCNESTISSGLMNPGEGSLQCTGGLATTSIPLNYYCTDFSTTEDWTTGIRTVIYDLAASSTEIFFTYTSCCWINLVTGGGNWAMKAIANVAKRTDTGKINSSPTTTVSPIVRVPYGCNTTINLLVADNDGDILRCRWSGSTDECGGICLSFPDAVLNEATCTISYQAAGSVGYYGVAVQVEDFASRGATVPYSSVPVQFLVYVYSTNQGCYSLPEFISPTRVDKEVVYITVNNIYRDKIIAISKVPDTSIDEITTVSPSGFIKSSLAKYPDVPRSWYVNITWTPTASDVNTLNILCFTATDKMRLTSQQRCINLIVASDVLVNGSNGIQFDFGLTNNDSVMSVNDGKCKLVSSKISFPVFCSSHKKIYICVTGILTFDDPFEMPGTVNGSDLNGRTILAPFFNDIDKDSLRHGGNVFYHVYDSANDDIKKSSNVRTTQDMIRHNHGDLGSFKAQFALFVTWHQVRPTRTEFVSSESMTFQLALLTDGMYSFVFYVYPKNYMFLERQQVFIGFTTKEGLKHVDYRSFTPDALQIYNLAMSLGYAGLLHYRLSFSSMCPKRSHQTCMDWYLKEKKYKDEYKKGLGNMPLCPCHTTHLDQDQFYRANLYFNQGDARCWYIRSNWQFQPMNSGKTCCYDTANNFFIGYGSNSGGFIRYHPNKTPLMHNHFDRAMRKVCCDDSDLCLRYHDVRPIGDCYTEFPASHAPASGDPHFMTLDGQNYTFNGWGEFTLLVINTSTEEFELQARTSRAVMKDGNLSDATSFTAFAARDRNNVSVHIELNAAKNDLIVYAKMEPSLVMSDYTSDYMNMSQDFILESEYISLSRRNQTKYVMVVFASGVAFTVGSSVQMLNIDVMIPNRFRNLTAGLLGNFDGDATNEFKFKNGTILQSKAGGKDIFNFGKSWVVDPDHSAFWYPQGTGYSNYSHLNYTPKFMEDLDPAKIASARDVCGEGQGECIFDLVSTQDAEVAYETRRLGYVSRQVDAILENKAPRISGPSVINVTSKSVIKYQLRAFDDGEVSYLILEGQKYANITDQKNGTADVTLLIQDYAPYNIRVTVVDKFGVVAIPHQVVIVVCSSCNNRGTCDFAEFRDDNRTTDSFKYATCVCAQYWDGPDCEVDRDGCATQPCSSLRQCTDVPADLHQASGVGYNCTDCPVGFASLSDGGCQDKNECNNSNGGCSQICNNTFGSFFCSCFAGYRIKNGECQDINECLEASYDCEQICNNTIGGYNCSCYVGFVYNSKTKRCDKGDIPSGCNSLNCSGTAGCTIDSHGNATCFCPKGFQMNLDGKTCNDTNECQQAICQHHCTNIEGSFYCSCSNGYSLQSDRSSCKECEPLKFGENCNNTCKCGQGTIRCDHIKGCICSDGWKGTNCDEDVDECLVPNICNVSLKVCVNTNGSYSCTCRDGYVLNTNGFCTDLDECSDPGLNTCEQICQNEIGGFSCRCSQGYVQRQNNTFLCEDIDECAIGQSGCEQLCFNSLGRFTCGCYFGYILNEDRKTCMKVEDVCVMYGNISCSQFCVLEAGQVACSCIKGYILSSDNKTCEDIDECNNKKLIHCSHNCTNTIPGYVCSCPNGFKLDNDKRTCKECDAFHYGPNCSNPCNCGIGAKRCHHIEGCKCKDGWHGNKCNQDQSCSSGFMNITGVCEDLDECSDPRLNDCNQICLNNIGNYTCTCHEGYISSGNTCSATRPTASTTATSGNMAPSANETAASTTDTDNSVLVGVATGMSLSVLAILVIVAIFCYKRKLAERNSSKNFMVMSDCISNQTYQCSAACKDTSEGMKFDNLAFNPSDTSGQS